MVDKTPEQIASEQAISSSEEQKAAGKELESFGKRLREIGSQRSKAVSQAVSEGVKSQLKNIAQKPKDLGRAVYGSLPPAAQAVLSGVGSIGSDIFSAFRGGDSQQAESTVTQNAGSKKADEESHDTLKSIDDNTNEQKESIHNLVSFMKGQRLEEYEERREEEFKHKELINAIDNIETFDEETKTSIITGFAGLKRLGRILIAIPLALGLTIKKVGLFLTVFTKALLSPLRFISGAFKLLLKPFALLGRVLPLLLKPLSFLASPLLLKAVGVIAAGLALFKIFSGDNLQNIVGSITSAWQENILPSLNKLKDSFNILKESKIGEFFSDTFSSIRIKLDTMKITIKNLFDSAMNIFERFASLMAQIIADIVESFGIAIGGTLTGISQMLSGDFGEGLLTIGKSLLSGLMNIFDSAISNILKLFGLDEFFADDGSFLSFMVRIISNLVDGITDKFTEVFSEVKEFLSRFSPANILESFSETVESVKAFFDRIKQRFENMIPTWLRRDEDSGELNDLIQDINNSLNGAKDSVGNFFTDVGDSVSESISLTKDFLNRLNPFTGTQSLERIINPSALVTGTATSLTLTDLLEMMESQTQNPTPNVQQVNVNNNSSSNVVMPQHSPHSRVESAQDVYGSQAY